MDEMTKTNKPLRQFSLAYDFNVPVSSEFTNLVGVKVPKGRRWEISAVQVWLDDGCANKVKIDIVKDPNGDILFPNNVGSAYVSAYETSSAMEGYAGEDVLWNNEFKEKRESLIDGEELVFRGKNSDSSAHNAGANVTIVEYEDN